MAATRLAPPTTLFAHQALNCSNKAGYIPGVVGATAETPAAIR